ncbi:MAG: tetratricopeptide repeat protein [Thiotrichaceae bacterium]|nr:tetratricopeptide repeat protein [Thiotrichaceae bacterium]
MTLPAMSISPRTSLILTSLALFAISFAIYYPTLNHEFLTWDTRLYVIDSPMIRSLAWENLWQMLTSLYMSNWHPLTWLSYAVDYALYGLNPWGFHLTNLLWHSANSVLFFLFSLQLLKLHRAAKSPLAPSHEENKRQFWIAALAALWFGIHPQHVESVVWIAERKDVLSLFFSLLTLISYLQYAQSRRLKHYLLSFLWFCLALMAKPMAVTLPIILLLLDIYPVNRTRFTASLQPEYLLKILIEKIPFFLGSAFDAGLTLLAQQQAIVDIAQISFIARLINAFNSLITYLSKFILPLTLSPLYPFDANLLNNPLALFAFPAVLMIAGSAFYAWRKHHFVWAIMLLFYVISLLPVLGIIQVGAQASADRYAYFPTLPFYLVLAAGCIQWLWHTNRLQRTLAALSILLISVGFGTITVQQSKIWENDLILWSYVASYAPNFSVTQTNLASAYYERGHYAAAVEHYKQALLYSNDGMIHYDLALAYAQIGDFENAIGIFNDLITYKIAIGVTPDKLHYLLGVTHLKAGHYPEARQALQQALNLNPKLEAARIALQKIPAATL